MKQETLKEAIKKHLHAKSFLADPNNTGFVDRFIEHTKAAEWGAEWQRNHVWHDAKEYPERGKQIIVFTESGNFTSWFPTENISSEFERFSVTKWAYVEDIVPKGVE